jgi:hypothetical protein
MVDGRLETRSTILLEGEDPPYVRDWMWPG